MSILAQLYAWLNTVTGSLFGLLDGFMTALPPWLSLTILSALLGIIQLIPFKYTSPQKAIGRTRDQIKARLLAMKLFKDNIPVVLKSQFRIFGSAMMLPIYYLPPLLVMILPFCLILGQLGAWYQARPLEVNEQAVVVMQLSGEANAPLPAVLIQPDDSFEVVAGPVRAATKQEIYWKVRPSQSGDHLMRFDVGGEQVEKTLTSGSNFQRVSMKRPYENHIGDLILYPVERPFAADSAVRSITIEYPARDAWFSGSGIWVISLVFVSILGALAVKPLLNVKL